MSSSALSRDSANPGASVGAWGLQGADFAGDGGPGGEIPHYSHALGRFLVHDAAVLVDLAAHAGVSLGSGTDILGARQSGRGAELSLKARVIGPMDAILSATRTNTQLFRTQNRTGCVKEGMEADLIAIAGEPLGDIRVLADGDNVGLVVKGGQVYKETIQLVPRTKRRDL